MGVCLINENFEDLRFSYYDNERAKEEEKENAKNKFMKGQQIITVNKFQLEKIKKQNLIKKKSHEAKNLGIEKNEPILLQSSAKKDRAKTDSMNCSDSKVFISATLKTKKYDIINYPKDALELINKIRNNPKCFIKDVETAMTNIKRYDNKIIYNGNVKIYLNGGEKMFKEAIDVLSKTQSMKPLTVKKDLEIEMPTEEEFMNDKDIFKKKILNKKKNQNIERYYREAIKDPYVGVLMMIVDDTSKNQGEKRITILNPLLNNIYINCKMYGKKFLAYLTFSK